MDWGAALQTIGAAGEGALEGYSWAQDQKFKKAQADTANRALNQKDEIARLNAEIKTMLEGMKESGRNERHDTASGSVVAQQEGANTRAAANNATRDTIARMTDETRRGEETGRNTRFESGITSKGILARMQDATRRYGIDTGASTARRGQDLNYDLGSERNDLTEQGQMLDYGADVMRDGTTRRGQDIYGTSRTGNGLPPPVAPPNVLPPGAPSPAPAAAPPPADPGRAALAQSIRAATAAVKAAKTPAEKAQALKTLQQLRAQVK